MQMIKFNSAESTSKLSNQVTHPFNEASCPCDSCEYSLKCKADNLACSKFLRYVEQGEEDVEIDTPTRRIFIKAFLNINESSLTQEMKRKIRLLNQQRGMSHQKIADMLYIRPHMVRKLVEEV